MSDGEKSNRWMLAGIATPIVAIPAVLVLLCTLTVITVFGWDDEQKAAATNWGALPCSAATGGELNPHEVPPEYIDAINAAAAASGLSAPLLAAQLYQESSWNPHAVSPAGAQGLAQMMPGTWPAYGHGSPFDPIAAIAAQGAFMGELYQTMQSWIAEGTVNPDADPVQLALAGYNAGPGAVKKHGGVPPYEETLTYVQTIPDLAQSTFGAPCAGPGGWSNPLPGSVLTSGYGPRWGALHAGIDIATPHGQAAGTVLSVTDMTITYAGCTSDGYGCSVVGRATDGSDYLFRYGHLATGSITVTTADTVTAGTPLGIEGATGDVRGVHLHLEIYAAGASDQAYASSGKSIDPLPILHGKGIVI